MKLPSTLNIPAWINHNVNILESLPADAELLGKAVGEVPDFDNDFYKLCILDKTTFLSLKGMIESK